MDEGRFIIFLKTIDVSNSMCLTSTHMRQSFGTSEICNRFSPFVYMKSCLVAEVVVYFTLVPTVDGQRTE